jgi:hypothetical protein
LGEKIKIISFLNEDLRKEIRCKCFSYNMFRLALRNLCSIYSMILRKEDSFLGNPTKMRKNIFLTNQSEDHLTTSFTQCCSIHVHIFHKCVLCLVDVQNQFHVGSLGNPTETRKHVFLTNQRTILQSHFTQSCTVQVSYFP